MVTLQLDKMTQIEKLQAMEAIWADLSKAASEIESPSWHRDVLDETQERVDSGAEQITDWETAKRVLRKQFECA